MFWKAVDWWPKARKTNCLMMSTLRAPILVRLCSKSQACDVYTMDMTTTNDLLVTQSAGIMTVTLNRPAQRNALTVGLANGLHDLWEQVDADDDVKVVVLTSADCGTF